MAEKEKANPFGSLKNMAQKSIANIDVAALKENAVKASETLKMKAGEAKDAAIAVKDDITEKLNELDNMLKESINEYNESYTLMNDKGVRLLTERTRATDTIQLVEALVNSIANRPKSFDADFEEININKKSFSDSCEYANRELKAAREAATGAGAGLAAGASVAFMAPTAAMWIATTFGTASTGTAISALSGAAATNAALAWLGGGALAAGGGGMAAGNAFLALAGPVGWTIAGATLLSSIIIFTSKKAKLNKQKNEEIELVKKNTEKIRELDAKITALLDKTTTTRDGINEMMKTAMCLYGSDYSTIPDEQKHMLAKLVNNTKILSGLFGETITESENNESTAE